MIFALIQFPLRPADAARDAPIASRAARRASMILAVMESFLRNRGAAR
jgi:hypothetical protein